MYETIEDINGCTIPKQFVDSHILMVFVVENDVFPTILRQRFHLQEYLPNTVQHTCRIFYGIYRGIQSQAIL